MAGLFICYRVIGRSIDSEVNVIGGVGAVVCSRDVIAAGIGTTADVLEIDLHIAVAIATKLSNIVGKHAVTSRQTSIQCAITSFCVTKEASTVGIDITCCDCTRNIDITTGTNAAGNHQCTSKLVY